MTEAFSDVSISEEEVRAALERIDMAEFADPEIIDFVCNYTPTGDVFKPKGLPLRVNKPEIIHGGKTWYMGFHDEQVQLAEVDFLDNWNGPNDGTHELGFPEEINYQVAVSMASLLQSFVAYASLVELGRIPRVDILAGATSSDMMQAAKKFGFSGLREMMTQQFETSTQPLVTAERVREIAGEITPENEYEFFEMVYKLGSISEGEPKIYFDELFNVKFRERFPAAENPGEDSFEVYGRYETVLKCMREYAKRHYVNYIARARKIAEAALTKD